MFMMDMQGTRDFATASSNSRTGNPESPQLPLTTVVTPWRTSFSAAGLRRKNPYIVGVKEETPMKVRLLALPVIILGLGACSTMYYGAMEKLGVHNRTDLVRFAIRAGLVRVED